MGLATLFCSSTVQDMSSHCRRRCARPGGTSRPSPRCRWPCRASAQLDHGMARTMSEHFGDFHADPAFRMLLILMTAFTDGRRSRLISSDSVEMETLISTRSGLVRHSFHCPSRRDSVFSCRSSFTFSSPPLQTSPYFGHEGHPPICEKNLELIALQLIRGLDEWSECIMESCGSGSESQSSSSSGSWARDVLSLSL